MPILEVLVQSTGLIGVTPKWVYIATDDTISQVTATGYLNQTVQAGYTFNESDMALVSTKTTPTATEIDVDVLNISYSNGNWSLVTTGSPGDVSLPTIANNIIVSTNTAGALANLTGTAINAGSLQAGLSGTAGALISFPSTASKGSLVVQGVANTGNTTTTISNAAMGQASVVSIPDPASATARFMVGATATPFVSGNIPKASGTGGLMVDSGTSASSLVVNGGAITASSLTFDPTTSGIIGTTTVDDASEGVVGEYLSSVVLGASGVSLTTNTPADLTHISLTAGDWDVWGNIFFVPTDTSLVDAFAWISNTSATEPDNAYITGIAVATGTISANGFSTAVQINRISIAITTSVYISAKAIFGGTCAMSGAIYARRAR